MKLLRFSILAVALLLATGTAQAVEGYIVFKGTTKGIVDKFYPTQALADAGSTESDLTAVQGAHELGEFRANKAYWDGTKLQPEIPPSLVFEAMTTSDQVKERRQYLFELLRRHEVVGGKISVWHGSRQDNKPEGDPPAEGDPDERLDESKRFASYGRWVEANVRAALVDENLTNAAKWAFLESECKIPGETWYWLHKVNGTRITAAGTTSMGMDQRPKYVGLALHDRNNDNLQLSDRCGAPCRI